MHFDEDDEPLLTRKQAYRRTGFTPSTFSTWDSRKTYDLKPMMRRGRIVYRQSVLDDFTDRMLIRQGKATKPQ